MDAGRCHRGVADLQIRVSLVAEVPAKKNFALSLFFSLTKFILLDILEYIMIRSTSHQAWIFYSPLDRQAGLLKDDLLDPVDTLLGDPVLIDLVRQCLVTRSPLSTRTG